MLEGRDRWRRLHTCKAPSWIVNLNLTQSDTPEQKGPQIRRGCCGVPEVATCPCANLWQYMMQSSCRRACPDNLSNLSKLLGVHRWLLRRAWAGEGAQKPS